MIPPSMNQTLVKASRYLSKQFEYFIDFLETDKEYLPRYQTLQLPGTYKAAEKYLKSLQKTEEKGDEIFSYEANLYRTILWSYGDFTARWIDFLSSLALYLEKGSVEYRGIELKNLKAGKSVVQSLAGSPDYFYSLIAEMPSHQKGSRLTREQRRNAWRKLVKTASEKFQEICKPIIAAAYLLVFIPLPYDPYILKYIMEVMVLHYEKFRFRDDQYRTILAETIPLERAYNFEKKLAYSIANGKTVQSWYQNAEVLYYKVLGTPPQFYSEIHGSVIPMTNRTTEKASQQLKFLVDPPRDIYDLLEISKQYAGGSKFSYKNEITLYSREKEKWSFEELGGFRLVLQEGKT